MLAILAAALLAAPPAAAPVRKLDLQLRNLPTLPAPPRKPVARKPVAPGPTSQPRSSPVRWLALVGSVVAAQALGFRDETPSTAAGMHFLGGGEAATMDARPH